MTQEEYEEECFRLFKIHCLASEISDCTKGLESLVKPSDDCYWSYREVDAYGIDLEWHALGALDEHLKKEPK